MSFSVPAIILVIGLAGLVLFWFTRRPMTPRRRRAAPGAFVRLGSGVIHYQWHGPENGPVLVMVHGLTTPSFVWREQIPALVEAGYRVLTFDHFGRGYSDRPLAHYDMEFYVREIDELLAALSVPRGYHLLGYSMGGGIATHFASVRRDRIEKLILLAPVGFLKDRAGWTVRWPVIGDLIVFLFGGIAMRRGTRKAGKAEGLDSEMIELQCRETRYAGYGAAVLSSARHVIYIDQTQEHELLRDRNMPLLTVFGTADDIIPISCAMRLREINRNARIVEIEGAGHALVCTHPDQVNAAILAFLR